MSLGQLPVTAKRNYIFRTYWTYRIKGFLESKYATGCFIVLARVAIVACSTVEDGRMEFDMDSTPPLLRQDS